ncbi:MAG: hypothetical protein RL092_220, partial [Bacteroidota bacterium]
MTKKTKLYILVATLITSATLVSLLCLGYISKL